MYLYVYVCKYDVVLWSYYLLWRFATMQQVI